MTQDDLDTIRRKHNRVQMMMVNEMQCKMRQLERCKYNTNLTQALEDATRLSAEVNHLCKRIDAIRLVHEDEMREAVKVYNKERSKEAATLIITLACAIIALAWIATEYT